MKMVLDYTCKHFDITCKVLSIRTIAKITKTNRDGTAPKAAENVNILLRKAKPPIGFRYREGVKFPEIRNEIDEERPVIALINMVELPRRIWHAVVIVDFDPDNNLVYYDDPEEDEKNCIKSLGWSIRKKMGMASKINRDFINQRGRHI